MIAYLSIPQWLTPEIIPGLPIRWYGIMYLLAFLLTYVLYIRQIRSDPYPALPVDARRSPSVLRRTHAERSPSGRNLHFDIFFWSILGLLIGARLGYVLLYGHELLLRPWAIVLPMDESGRFVGWQGMSYHGGLLGLAVSLIAYCRKHALDAWVVSDRLAVAAPAGYIFGRVGNFLNGELYGRVSAAPWAVLFPGSEPLPTGSSWVLDFAARNDMSIAANQIWMQLPRHPSQLYEALGEGLLLWFLLWTLTRHKQLIPGTATAIYLAGYAIARFVSEYFRQPDLQLGFVLKLGPQDNPVQLLLSPLNFTLGQVLSLVMLAVAALVYFRARARYASRPVFEQLEPVDSHPV